MDLEEYYKNLLIIQYRNKPKALATIGLMVNTIIQNNISVEVGNAFARESAVGKQLDILGKYLGVDRFLPESLSLTDEEFRFIMDMKVIQNNSDFSNKSIDEFLFNFYGKDVIASGGDRLSITYFVKDDLVDKIKLADSKGVLPRPIGIKINGVIKKDKKYFGFCTYNNPYPSELKTGFSTYTDSKEGECLTYDKVISL